MQHRGRLIKEAPSISAVSKSIDVPRIQSLPQIASGVQAAEFKKQIFALNPVDSTDEGSSYEKLRRRVRELEIENERLSGELIQNEKSINNYRSFLAGLEVSKRSVSIQTDTCVDVVPVAAPTVDAEILLKISTLEIDIKKATDKLKAAQDKNTELAVKSASEKQFYERRISELESEDRPKMPEVNVTAPSQLNVAITSETKIVQQNNLLTNFEQEVHSLKEAQKLHRQTSLDEIEYLREYFSTNSGILLSLVNKFEVEKKSLAGELDEMKDKYDVLKSSYSQEQGKWARASVDLAASQSTIETLRTQLAAVELAKSSTTMHSRGCDPLSPLADRSRRELQIETCLEDARALEVRYKGALEALLANTKAALVVVDEVATKHTEEVKATKHIAHVKDLGRVATIREVNLKYIDIN